MMIFKKIDSKNIELLTNLDDFIMKEDSGIIDVLDKDTYLTLSKKYPIEENPSNDVIVCLKGNEIVGRIDLMYETSYMDFSKVGYIDWVYVRKAYRNQGIGKALLKEADKLFREKACFKYYLFVADNEAAKAFYKTSGLEIKTMKTAVKILKEDK